MIDRRDPRYAAQVDLAVEAALYRAYHFAHSLEHALELEAQDPRVMPFHAEAKALRKSLTAQLFDIVATRHSTEEPIPTPEP